MVATNRDPMRTAFTVSVDYKEGLTTGISADERSEDVASARQRQLHRRRLPAARPRLPAYQQGRRRPDPLRPHGSRDRPLPPGRTAGGGRARRGRQRRRQREAAARADRLRQGARTEDRLDRRSDRAPDQDGILRAADRDLLRRDADRARRPRTSTRPPSTTRSTSPSPSATSPAKAASPAASITSSRSAISFRHPARSAGSTSRWRDSRRAAAC